ncbi:hypothetical protein [Flavobacterium branchiicola]|uniref:YD repeat-containing protein n=1 Tax=Flavobacterium branchiicola TaxID=1114875 RepID=A0ABV9PEE7_9FLAO|nr:hypothetical protein [Flavobacterium branchiicola]MBS7253825.1 hypothetical protein [Flavobacterium branchiicola]
MKFLYLLFFFIFFNVHAQDSQNAFAELKGNPKEYKETWYEAKKTKTGFVKGKYLHDDVYGVNAHGEIIKQGMFPAEKWEIPQNSYNKENQKIETINYNEEGGIKDKTKFIYDKNKLVKENIYDDSDVLFVSKKYEYLNNLAVRKLEFRTENGTLKTAPDEITTYEYDAKNNISTESTAYDDEYNAYAYKYNDKNLITEIYSKSSFPVRETEFKVSIRYNYQKYDVNNWTEMYLEDGLSSDGKPSYYFIEREFKY